MTDKQDSTAVFRKEILFPALFGDWMTYRPSRDASKQAKVFSFSSHRIPAEALEEALKIHYFFALEFAKYIKEALKASTDVLSAAIEQISYADFLKRFSGGLIYNKLQIPDAGDILFLIDYQLANQVINFSLGFPSADEKMKELTELEESMIHSIFGKMLEKFPASWGNIFAKPELEILSYPNIQRETHINLNEAITAITIQLSIANSAPATFTFAYQNSTLKKLFEKFMKKKEKAPLNFSLLSGHVLSSVQIPVFAQLGTTQVAAGDLLGIDAGDAIALDQRLNSPIDLVIGYVTELKAQPGTSNGRFAAKVIGGSARKIKNEIRVMEDIEPAETVHHDEARQSAAPGQGEFEISAEPQEKEEDMLPMELEEKEEYNEPSEELFGEENDIKGEI